MQNETRVNLKHLLEDIRDSYTHPLEEVILTELIANALDSKATEIHFEIGEEDGDNYIRSVDNGQGMKRAQIKEYHNIASSTKSRGFGIGFAGVGAKLSLLLAKKVVTESKGGYGSQCATEWSLTTPYRAPWKFTPYSGTISTSRGTSVAIFIDKPDNKLFSPEFVEDTVIKHFYPLLADKFYNKILKYFYKKPLTFYVNGKKIFLSEESELNTANQNWFDLRLGKSRSLVGVGFLGKIEGEVGWIKRALGHTDNEISLNSGLWISTFGKVIKGGWEWLGITPKNAGNLTGLVEIPSLSEILTTNKNDFLQDSNSLKKYYKVRKAVQEAVLPILEKLGESQTQTSNTTPDKILRPLNKTITGALNRLVKDFPELEGLVNARTKQVLGRVAKNVQPDKDITVKLENENNANPLNKILENSGSKNKATNKIPSGISDATKSKTIRAKSLGLHLMFGELDPSASGLSLGRLVDDTLTINTTHSAWKKAKDLGYVEYHVIVVTALVLSQFLENEKDPEVFFNKLLSAWASEDDDKKGRLF